MAGASLKSGSKKAQKEKEQLGIYQMPLSLGFILVSFGIVTCTSFGIGSLARLYVLEHSTFPATELPNIKVLGQLPQLWVGHDKQIPHTDYTSKNYDITRSRSSDNFLSHHPNIDEEHDENNHENATFLLTDSADDPMEEIHEPAGQHLLVDIEHVDGAFLNSEHHLAQAMIDLVKQSGLTMLSYHCHTLQPAGVSCAGVLLESHVSFHTWPVQGVITLDLFTCGPNSLLNLLGDIKALFARHAVDSEQEPNIIWSFKHRGFPLEEGYAPGISDLYSTLLGVMQFPQKEQEAFFQSSFQQVHIYNVLDPKYDKMDRRFYLDGVLQARQRGQAVFAEALVHPAMMAHENPQRVAIVGGGDGASLREVLKHSSVQNVDLMEIDQDVVSISKEWLWSRCDDFLSFEKCWDDPRLNLYYQDGFEWFLEHYNIESRPSEPKEAKQDVIIMDVLNPEDEIDFSEVLFDDLEFAELLYEALDSDGILAVHLGRGQDMEDPAEYATRDHHVATLVTNLEQAGFDSSILMYEESHGGVLKSATSSFLVAFKNDLAVQNWFSTEAMIQAKIQKRILPTHDGKLPLISFDGATMQSYQMASRPSEVLFCRNQLATNASFGDCEHGLDPERVSVPMSSLELQEDGAVVATEDIKKGSYLGLEACLDKLHTPADSLRLLLSQRGSRYGQKLDLLTDFSQRFKDHTKNSDVVNEMLFSIAKGYNPFRDRNSVTHACLLFNQVPFDIATNDTLWNVPASQRNAVVDETEKGCTEWEPPMLSLGFSSPTSIASVLVTTTTASSFASRPDDRIYYSTRPKGTFFSPTSKVYNDSCPAGTSEQCMSLDPSN